MIKIKRVYAEKAPQDGFRVLVDRFWPRGMRKEEAGVDLWLREIAPSNELRKWYGHDPDKWEEFKRRYFSELEPKDELLNPIREKAREGVVTLLFSTREERFNNAQALKEYLECK